MLTKFFAAKTLPLAAGLLLFAAPALPDVWNKKTYFTFSHSVELPGHVTLPPGTYTMKVVDSPSNRYTVMVQNRDENKVYATFFTVPKQRERPTGKTVLSFYETPGSHPQFIKAWFYPGDTIGREFIYSKERRTYIASLIRGGSSTTTETQVVASANIANESESRTDVYAQERAAGGGDTKVAENSAAISDNNDNNLVAENVAPAVTEETPEPIAEPTPEPVQEAAAEPVQAQATPSMPTELPKTGSPMALIGLGGLTMLGSAAWLRRRKG
jgi:LPXTG-motif cell wall-anchored protein